MRLRVDFLVLIVAVTAIFRLAPGHGVWGYVLGLLMVALLGSAVGLVGRKYPQIYGQRSRRRGSQ